MARHQQEAKAQKKRKNQIPSLRDFFEAISHKFLRYLLKLAKNRESFATSFIN